MECFSCKQKSGEIQISPSPAIYSDSMWRVEHAYPTSLKGWLVIVLQRHAEALHELTKEEWADLADIQSKLLLALHQVTKSKKEYIAQFAEKEGFQHIHFHIIPRMDTILDDYKGPNIFKHLKVTREEAVPAKELSEFCNLLIKSYNQAL
ncbi:MAG: HIT family protein [Candidatus Andersenbacteria bacterium]